MRGRQGTGWPKPLEEEEKLKDFETVRVLMELSQARHTGCAFLFLCFTPGEVDVAPVKAASLLHIMPEFTYMPWPALVPGAWVRPTCPGACILASITPEHLSPSFHMQSILICSCTLQSALVKLCFHIEGDVKLERGAPCIASLLNGGTKIELFTQPTT